MYLLGVQRIGEGGGSCTDWVFNGVEGVGGGCTYLVSSGLEREEGGVLLGGLTDWR